MTSEHGVTATEVYDELGGFNGNDNGNDNGIGGFNDSGNGTATYTGGNAVYEQMDGITGANVLYDGMILTPCPYDPIKCAVRRYS